MSWVRVAKTLCVVCDVPPSHFVSLACFLLTSIAGHFVVAIRLDQRLGPWSLGTWKICGHFQQRIRAATSGHLSQIPRRRVRRVTATMTHDRSVRFRHESVIRLREGQQQQHDFDQDFGSARRYHGSWLPHYHRTHSSRNM